MADRTSDIVISIQEATTGADVASILSAAVLAAGFRHFIVAAVSRPKVEPGRVVLAHDWPSGWYDRYYDRHYARHDPVLRHSFRTMEAFLWKEAPFDPSTEPHAQQVMGEARAFGLRGGLCIPLHAPDGTRAVVSMGGDDLDLDPPTRLSLHMIGLYAFSRLRVLLPHDPWKGTKLTDRELDALRWTARGKTGHDIATLMGVSEKTVEFYFNSIAEKLGTISRTHSVAEALRFNLLDF